MTIACRYGQTERQDSHDKVEKHGFVRKSMYKCYKQIQNRHIGIQFMEKWLGKHICLEGICTPYADGRF